MKKRILAYTKYVDAILASEEDRDWEREISRHKDQIAFFAHERLVHLLVFFLVAVCTVISILTMVVSEKIVILPLIVLLFVLLVPYCMHYYLLENQVQYMYRQYDAMVKKAGDADYYSAP